MASRASPRPWRRHPEPAAAPSASRPAASAPPPPAHPGELAFTGDGIKVALPLPAPLGDATFVRTRGAATITGFNGTVQVAATFAVSTAAIDRAATCGESAASGGVAAIEVDATNPI